MSNPLTSLIHDAQTVLVAAHDAGGAELVSAWVKAHPGPDYRFVVDGPARAVFARRFCATYPVAVRASRVWIDEADAVLTATSYGSPLEDGLRRQAHAAGKPVIAYLDHWINYPPRFAHSGAPVLPDELWLADETAALIARALFPAVRLVLAGNPYVAELRAEAARRGAPCGASSRVLYVSEPTSRANLSLRGDARLDGYDEFDALRLFLTWCERQTERGEVGAILFRAHPSEAPEKYASILASFRPLEIAVSSQTTLLDDCLWAGGVCGCSSMALYVAQALQREVLCAIPTAGAACLLPLTGISYLREQVAVAAAHPSFA